MSANEGLVFNIQRYSIDDGPGIRTTVFLKGCPLRCPWCSNPESQSASPCLQYRITSCKRCGACAEVCPNGAITLGAEGLTIDRDKCEICGTCVRECVDNALKISGEVMSVDKVMKTIRKDALYYETSGGGVTCSGGEILSQADFTAEIFKRCHEEGIHTCADTSGFGTEASIRMVLEHADLVYFDLKHAEPERHKELTSVPLETILQNLKIAANSGKDLVIRVPLIPEYNSSEHDITALAGIIRDMCPGAPVHILPYHKYGANKYASVGMVDNLENLRDITEDEINMAKNIFLEHNLKCEISK